LNIYFSSDGGTSYSSAYVQAGGANGITVPVKLKLSDKVSGENNFVLKLEAANTIELWNLQMNGYERIKSGLKHVNSLINNIKCSTLASTGNLYLTMDLSKTAEVQIDLFNALGMYVSNIKKQFYPSGKNYVITDINQFPGGLYFVRFTSGNETISFKIIKN
jgi:hypothetical protein